MNLLRFIKCVWTAHKYTIDVFCGKTKSLIYIQCEKCGKIQIYNGFNVIKE